MWRCLSLRATGFPARWVLELGDPELGVATDRLLELETTLVRIREDLKVAYRAALERAGPNEKAGVRRAQKHLGQGRVPEASEDSASEAIRVQLADVDAARAAQMHELVEHHARARRMTSAALRVVAQDDRFRQAVLWQNRPVVRTTLDWILQQPIEANDSDTRRKECLIATYLQRYCVKNDTIGFFGPVGWARWTDDRDAVSQRPGLALLASRTVYYEYWAIDALAAQLARDPELRPFIAPRGLPHLRLEGTTLHAPLGRRAELPDELATVLAGCDGVRTARELAGHLGLDEAEVFASLDELVEAGVITWTFEIPTADPHPERHLAALLARIEPAPLRARAEAALAELEGARAAVAAASDAATLDAALVTFEDRFTAATSASSQRASGQTYAGRTPLFEDTTRDLEVALGQPLVERLGPPLELLLDSARWFTHEIAARYRRELDAIFADVSDHGGVVEFARFWQRVPPLFPGGGAAGSIVSSVRQELQRRWAEVLAIAPGEQQVRRRVADLAEPVRRAFDAPGPGWPAARHHSPDVMIAAEGPEAIARGELQFVVGELHVGLNTVTSMLFAKQHPAMEELVASREADLDEPCIAPVWSKAVSRADYYSISRHDLDLENGVTRSARPRTQVVAVSELVVERGELGLQVRTRDGVHCFDIIAFLEHHLIAESYAVFSPIAGAPHTPRVTIDDVVIARETWRILPSELSWLTVEVPVERFIAARRWAKSLGLPRWVFVKTPEEVKPVYVDLDLGIYVEILARMLRGASSAWLSEMLPSIEQAWVVDRDGARYTSELRVATVDPLPGRMSP
ncbi:MAG: hypothetical protein JWP01_1942 [Myxococcales bacterium]|nr:hypothetical protein [Myxococcales bacterium]